MHLCLLTMCLEKRGFFFCIFHNPLLSIFLPSRQTSDPVVLPLKYIAKCIVEVGIGLWNKKYWNANKYIRDFFFFLVVNILRGTTKISNISKANENHSLLYKLMVSGNTFLPWISLGKAFISNCRVFIKRKM